MDSLARAFKSNTTTIQSIINWKIEMIKKTMEVWPKFVILNEDRVLMKDKWKTKYKNMRILFWDNTNVIVLASTDPNINRHTYSHYYNGTVAKGAVFLQLCGWIGTWEFPTAGIKNRAKFLRPHNNLQTFTNIVDKGYRCGMAAWRAGKQLVLQPVFAKSDTKQQVHCSANVAADRSGNERAVKMAKHSALIE
jgi:hypothetical protein